METHGGTGRLWQLLYRDQPRGIVFERDTRKAEALTLQRPTWAVYETDCAPALASGAGAHLPINFLDIDPYGQAWPAIEAFFGSERPRPARCAIAVNDGLRQKLCLHAGWQVETMQSACLHFGNNQLFDRYLEVAHWNLARIVAQVGYVIAEWSAYYCGNRGLMTHFGAVLSR